MFCYTCGIIGHGTNSCSHATITGEDQTSPPLRVPWRPAVRPIQTEDVAAMRMEMDSTVVDPQELNNPINSTPDPEFGSWMLVSRWRGHARGRGAVPRPDPASVGATDEENSVLSIPKAFYPEVLG